MSTTTRGNGAGKFTVSLPYFDLNMAFHRANATVKRDLIQDPEYDGFTTYKLKFRSVELVQQTNVNSEPVFEYTFVLLYGFNEE